jgi:hypothetical protein
MDTLWTRNLFKISSGGFRVHKKRPKTPPRLFQNSKISQPKKVWTRNLKIICPQNENASTMCPYFN